MTLARSGARSSNGTGAWAGASWATRIRTATLRVLTGLLVVMAAALVWTHASSASHNLNLPGPALAVLGLVAGFAIGVVAAVMVVAGGQLPAVSPWPCPCPPR